MKNYYKILGLKETASADEIHDRWIELMQEFHPDHGIHGETDEERAKEINEAYQVLKYSSTRMEYDFERLEQKRLKKFPIWKFIFPVSGLTFLLILSFIIFEKPRVPTQSNVKPQLPPSSQPEFSSIPHDEPGPHVNSTQSESKPKTSLKVEKEEKVISKRMAELPPIPHDEPGPHVNSTQSESKPKTSLKVEKEEKVISKRMAKETREAPAASGKRMDPPLQTVRSEISKEPPSILPPREIDHPLSVKDQKPIPLPEPPEKVAAVHPVSDPDTPATVKDRVAEVKPPLLMTTEDEVKRFFVNYIERYTRRDIHGFLSFFSSKAIQNKKDGLEGIRRIYENFFNQSQELRYRMEDTKIEIYQNAVEVKARYELDQISKEGGEKKNWKGQILWILAKENGVLKIVSLEYLHQSSP